MATKKTCRKCGASLRMTPHYRTGNYMPLERDDERGTWCVKDELAYPAALAPELGASFARFTSHFATCPAADRFRKTKTKGAA